MATDIAGLTGDDGADGDSLLLLGTAWLQHGAALRGLTIAWTREQSTSGRPAVQPPVVQPRSRDGAAGDVEESQPAR
jgi:hypothetical protein